MPERRSSYLCFKTKPRFLNGLIYGFVKNSTKQIIIQVFNSQKREVYDFGAQSRCDGGFAVLNNKLFIIGGQDGGHNLNTVEFFDSETKKWTKVASMNYKRR